MEFVGCPVLHVDPWYKTTLESSFVPWSILGYWNISLILLSHVEKPMDEMDEENTNEAVNKLPTQDDDNILWNTCKSAWAGEN